MPLSSQIKVILLSSILTLFQPIVIITIHTKHFVTKKVVIYQSLK